MVTKQTVKSYMESEGISEKLKDNIDNPNNWEDFKDKFPSLIAKYSSETTLENKNKIYELIERNFVNPYLAKELVSDIFLGLGISEPNKEGKRRNPEKEKYYNDIYSEIFGESARNSVKEVDRAIKSGNSEEIEKLKKYYQGKQKSLKDGPKKETKSKKFKGDGKVKQLVKKMYYRLTALALSAPGKVPPEMLAENKELLKTTSEKLKNLRNDLHKAKQTKNGSNNKRKDKLPDKLKEKYEKMNKGELSESEIEEFEEEISLEEKSKLEQLRENMNDMIQIEVIDAEFRKFAEEKFGEMSISELSEELNYVFEDAKVDRKGNLVLPARSIFKDVLFDEKGKVKIGQDHIVELITTRCEAKKARNLSDKDILELAKSYKFPKMQKDFEEGSNCYQFLDFVKNHPGLVTPKAKENVENIRMNYDEYEVGKDVLEETEIAHKILLVDDLQFQFQTIDDIVQAYDKKEKSSGELSKKDSKKREIALKIARRKVANLKKKKISKVIDEGEKNSKGVIKRAREILLPRLENVRNSDLKKFEKTFINDNTEDKEEQEQGE